MNIKCKCLLDDTSGNNHQEKFKCSDLDIFYRNAQREFVLRIQDHETIIDCDQLMDKLTILLLKRI